MTPTETSVLRMARRHRQQVSAHGGECWALVEQVLIEAGADVSGALEYRWGQEIPIGEADAGDIVQFECRSGFTLMRTPGDVTDGDYFTDGAHTAIIELAYNNGRSFRLRHQNWRGRNVSTTTWYFSECEFSDPQGAAVEVSRVFGRWTFYRPLPGPQVPHRRR